MTTRTFGAFPSQGLSVLEWQVWREEAKGLSHLEVGLRLFLYDHEVRAIARRLRKRALNGKSHEPLALRHRTW